MEAMACRCDDARAREGANGLVQMAMFNNNLCEFKQIHRFNESKLLQDAHTCANGKDIDFNSYSKEQPKLCLCWTNQAVDAIN